MTRSLIHCVWAAFLVFCSFVGVGCDRRSDRSGQALELQPPNIVVDTQPSLLSVSVPPGMTVVHSLTLRSRLETTLTDLKIASSCGCTSAKFDRTSVNPGETITLRCAYDAGTVAKTQRVRIQLFSPVIPTNFFRLDMQFKTDRDRSDILISAVPSQVFIGEDWQTDESTEYEIHMTFGERVPQDALRVTTSADYVDADLRGNLLRVKLESPPVGRIDEFVTIAFSHGTDTYSAKISVTGKIRPWLIATPGFLNFSDVARGNDMVGEIQLEAVKASSGEPHAVVQGDWKLRSLEQVSERAWSLQVCLKSLTSDELRYGQILVSGDWKGKFLKIPLTGNFANASP